MDTARTQSGRTAQRLLHACHRLLGVTDALEHVGDVEQLAAVDLAVLQRPLDDILELRLPTAVLPLRNLPPPPSAPITANPDR